MTDERILAEALINKPMFKRKDVAQRYGVDLRTVDRWQHIGLRATHSDVRGPIWTLRELVLFETSRPWLTEKSPHFDRCQQTLSFNG